MPLHSYLSTRVPYTIKALSLKRVSPRQSINSAAVRKWMNVRLLRRACHSVATDRRVSTAAPSDVAAGGLFPRPEQSSPPSRIATDRSSRQPELVGRQTSPESKARYTSKNRPTLRVNVTIKDLKSQRALRREQPGCGGVDPESRPDRSRSPSSFRAISRVVVASH
jgi:hypothetical protein